jgi:superfamily I DNA and RNA helicase
MVEVIVGEKRNPFAAEALFEQVSPLPITGTLYLGYPIIASADQMILVDALLTSLEHGIVVFDFDGHEGSPRDTSIVQQHQDDLYAALFQKLYSFKLLRTGKALAIPLKVITITLDQRNEKHETELLVVSYQRIREEIERFPPISSEMLRNVNAAIQRVTTIKPPQKRASVLKAASKGGVLKKIESEIANLDEWQKLAAIETPEGPQRIRGLAGAGKTIVLALKAAFLHSRNKDWKIAVTFQTRSLYQQLRDLIRRFTFDQIHDEPDWNNLKVLHAWGSQSEAGVYSEICLANDLRPRDFLYAKEHYGAERGFQGICEELLASIKDSDVHPIYDAILIDEAQDFPKAFFELAWLATQMPKKIIWAYDELQNLGAYSMAPPSELFGQEKDGSPRVPELKNERGHPHRDIVLPVCYRNTPWALTVAHALGFGIYREGSLVQFFDDPDLWKDIGYEMIVGEMKSGSDVELRRSKASAPQYFTDMLDPLDAVQCFRFQNDEEQARWLAESVRKNIIEDELELRDILIVISNPITATKRAALVMRELEKFEIPSHVAGVTTSKDVLFSDDSVAISSIYRAKGNEAPMVYLLDSDYCYSGYELIKNRNILFTVISRSRGWVRMAGCGPEMIELSNEVQKVIDNNYCLKFKVPTPDELEKMRRIHRDMTKKEKDRTQNIERTLESFAELAERGDLSLEQLPPELKDRLKTLFQEK